MPKQDNGEAFNYRDRVEAWAKPVTDPMRAAPLSTQIGWASARYAEKLANARKVTRAKGESAKDFAVRQRFYASFTLDSASKVYCVVAAPEILNWIADAEWAAVRAGQMRADADLSAVTVYAKKSGGSGREPRMGWQ